MLKLKPQPCYSQLPNGLMIASEERRGLGHVTVGLFIDGGSRYESSYSNGIAHFFEHIAFSGTCNRSPAILREQMVGSGATFKCFTGRELVGFYATCISGDVNLIVDILADCVYNNAMCYNEIEKQKCIVYQEMIEKDSDPNAVLDDYIHGAAFMGTPLAFSVMGKSSNLESFCEQTIRAYVAKCFDPSRTTLAAVGCISHKQLVDLAMCYLSKLDPAPCTDSYYRFTAGDFRFRDDSLQYCNTAIAFEAPCLCDYRSWAMLVASRYIGGWDHSQPGGHHNARHLAKTCFHGHLGHSYRSFYHRYKDTGLWGVQFLGNKLELDMMLYNVQEEFMTLCTMITKNEVDRAKHELKADIMSHDRSTAKACIDLARWTLYYGRRPTTMEWMCEVDSVTPEDVHSNCYKFVYSQLPAIAGVGPVEGIPHNSRLSAGQYWLKL